jgi:hypothetical protein
MELEVRPDDLQAAALALLACSARLDDAALTFARRAQQDLPAIGVKAAIAASHGTAASERAVQILSTDVSRLAHALAGLAAHYPRVDAGAVPHR